MEEHGSSGESDTNSAENSPCEDLTALWAWIAFSSSVYIWLTVVRGKESESWVELERRNFLSPTSHRSFTLLLPASEESRAAAVQYGTEMDAGAGCGWMDGNPATTHLQSAPAEHTVHVCTALPSLVPTTRTHSPPPPLYRVLNSKSVCLIQSTQDRTPWLLKLKVKSYFLI